MRPLLFVLLLLSSALIACKKDHRPARCYTAVDCASDQACILLPSSAQTCLDRCDLATVATCAGGEACAAVSAEDAQVAVCLPGGTVPLGGDCTSSVDCVFGAVCIGRIGLPSPRCEQLCTVGGADNPCAATDPCTAIDPAMSTTRGTCIAP